jgi:O-antigen biosynthesis protein
MPVYNVEERYLREAIESVRAQLYENWELCIADDHSPSPHIRRVLDEYIAADERIRVVYREKNGHISAASNSALEIVQGEFTALMDHDDRLSEDAVFRVALAMNTHPDVNMIYSDEDKIDASSKTISADVQAGLEY